MHNMLFPLNVRVHKGNTFNYCSNRRNDFNICEFLGSETATGDSKYADFAHGGK